MNNEFKPIFVENETIIFKPLTNNNSQEFRAIENGLLAIFSDKQVLHFHPEKELKSVSDAATYVLGTLIGYGAKIHYNHFIFEKKTNRVIGIIEIRSPLGVLSKYEFLEKISEQEPILKNTWVVEYYLNPEYWGRGIISLCLSLVIDRILINPATTISAFTQTENIRSKRILDKHKFIHFITYEKGLEHWIKIKNMTV